VPSNPSHDTEQRDVNAKLSFARIKALGFLDKEATYEQALMDSLVPGTMVERYGRSWYMGQWHLGRDNRVILGRIGFERPDTTELWSRVAKDFEPSRLRMGQTSPFAIRLSDFNVVFQLRSGVIRQTTFTSNLQALLNEASPVGRWRVTADVEEDVEWSTWKGSVDRVVELALRVDRPNPSYRSKRVRELVEGTNSTMVRIILNADPADLQGIDVDDEFVTAAIDHGLEYGWIHATGEVSVDGETERLVWKSETQGSVPTRTVSADPETREVSEAALLDELEQDTDEDTDVPLLQAGDENEEPPRGLPPG
jgi:hypothetical protein